MYIDHQTWVKYVESTQNQERLTEVWDKYVCCHPYYLMLSPLIFNIYLDEFVREGSEGRDEGQKKLDLDLLPIDFDFWLSAFEWAGSCNLAFEI